MVAMRALLQSLLLLGCAVWHSEAQGLSDVPCWCGKPYQSGSPNLDPGGKLDPPKVSIEPRMHFQSIPRHSIYVSNEKRGDFLVYAILSYTHGEFWPNSDAHSLSVDKLTLDIKVDELNLSLGSGQVPVNSTANFIEVDFENLEPRMEPYEISVRGESHIYPNAFVSARSQLSYLPAKRNGSMVKVDNLHGGLLVANNATNFAFEPLLPFGFYTGCSQYLNFSSDNVLAYRNLGLTAINPGCAFDGDDLNFLFDWLDEYNLWYQYNMRWSYTNLTWVKEQIPHVKDRSNLLSWYTADEPDGAQDPLNSTLAAYELLKRIDPYHPTALVLNCENYHFREYSSGADYILEDAYPVGTNVTFSRRYNTVCNSTYGDCGCDNCSGELQDVSDRLDTFTKYQEWIGGFPKPLWAVLQAFSGEQFWDREPTPEETWAMMILSFNHRAKGIMSWVFPTSSALKKAYAKMAACITHPSVSRFLIGSQPKKITLTGHPELDVAYWILDNQMLLGLVNLDRSHTNESVNIPLPAAVEKINSQPFGPSEWDLGGNGTLFTKSLEPLMSSYVILDLQIRSVNNSLPIQISFR